MLNDELPGRYLQLKTSDESVLVHPDQSSSKGPKKSDDPLTGTGRCFCSHPRGLFSSDQLGGSIYLLLGQRAECLSPRTQWFVSLDKSTGGSCSLLISRHSFQTGVQELYLENTYMVDEHGALGGVQIIAILYSLHI